MYCFVPTRFRNLLVPGFFFVLLTLTARAKGEAPPLLASSIVDLGFSDLMKIPVTSVSRKEDTVAQAAAAVHVLTSEDIERSGATNLPDLLRLVPGLQVAQTSANTWAISSRGFNSTAAQKLQVLIDGRSVYSPLFSGVFWDAQNIILDHIERIEVIRGPGAAVWGANAVNGVINIIRKPASETQGTRISAGGGTEEKAFGEARYGDTLGPRGFYRVYGQYFDRDESRARTGGGAQDNMHMGFGGFRTDLDVSKRDAFLFAGDMYAGEEGQTSPVNALTSPFRTTRRDQTQISGGNIMGRWTRSLAPRNKIRLQMFYDHTRRNIPLSFKEERDTGDVDFQHELEWTRRQTLIWGLGVRVSADRVRDSFGVDFDPDEYTSELYSAFLQDEIRIGRFIFTLGSKLEQNDYTGFELQPNARAAWLINDRHTLWTSVARAVRMPTRFDRDIRVQAVTNPAPLTTISFRGSDDFDSEELVAYEMGIRSEPHVNLFLDLSTFYNVYDNLRSLEPGDPFTEADPAPSHTVAPFYFMNKSRADSYGVEFSPQIQLTNWWRIKGQYTYLHLRLHLENDSRDTVTLPQEGNDPSHQASLQSNWNLPSHLELDATVRYVDNLPSLNVPSYTVLDLRLAYVGVKGMTLELVGQNLLKKHHTEFSPGNDVERGAYARATWSY